MEQPLALIVEHDRDIAALFRHVLDVAGYRTEIVTEGRATLERLKTILPDIVLLDLALPGIPGLKILEWMRLDSRLQHTLVVVVSDNSPIAYSLPVEPDLVLLKPVNLSQLSNLVQRLRSTPLAPSSAPWDPITHLYNQEFFRVRLGYSLQRARQNVSSRFGVLFVDVWPFAVLRSSVGPEQLEIFLREIAGHLKTSLRPTDTVSHIDNGRFLVLIEDIPDYSLPANIASRIDRELGGLIASKKLMDGLRANVAVLVCHGGYESIDDILADVETACTLSVRGPARSEYQHDMLRRLQTR